MPELIRYTVVRHVIGQARLKRLLHAGWLKPVERNGRAVLFDPGDVHAALRRMERKVCPPDRIEVTRVRASEVRNGHLRVRKEKVPPPGLDAIELDWSAVNL